MNFRSTGPLGQYPYIVNGSVAQDGQRGKEPPSEGSGGPFPPVPWICLYLLFFWVPGFPPLVDRGARKFTPPGPSCDGDRDGVTLTQH